MTMTQDQIADINLKVMLFCNNLRNILDKQKPIEGALMDEQQRNFMAAAAVISECYRNDKIRAIMVELRIMPSEEQLQQMLERHNARTAEMQAQSEAVKAEEKQETVQ